MEVASLDVQVVEFLRVVRFFNFYVTGPKDDVTLSLQLTDNKSRDTMRGRVNGSNFMPDVSSPT